MRKKPVSSKCDEPFFGHLKYSVISSYNEVIRGIFFNDFKKESIPTSLYFA